MLRYNIRRTLIGRGLVSVIWTPFEVFRLIISIEVPPIIIDSEEEIQKVNQGLRQLSNNSEKAERGSCVKFMLNFMDYGYNLERIDNQNRVVGDMAQLYYTDDSHINYYELAERVMRFEYTNQRKARFLVKDGKEK